MPVFRRCEIFANCADGAAFFLLTLTPGALALSVSAAAQDIAATKQNKPGSVGTAAGKPVNASRPPDQRVEEIQVTASRTGRQSVQTLPMAVTALNPKTLESLGLTSLLDISRLAPSLSMTEEGPGISSITIRGLAVRGIDTSETEDRPLVTTYLDDTPLSVKSSNPDVNVVDLEDVEVLRGPQGTLYGAGAMAGTIRLITQKPDPRRFFGYVEGSGSGTAGYGGFNDTGRFMVNVPLLKDQLAVRISGYHEDMSGYIKNVSTGLRQVATGETSNPESSNQARVALRWTPTRQLTVDFSVMQQVLNGGLNYAQSLLPQYQTASPTQDRSDQNLMLYALALRYDFPHISLSSSTSYTHFRTRFDTDESATNHYYNFGNQGPQQPASFVARNMINDIVEELRATTHDMGPLQLTGGVFYETGTRGTSEEDPTAGIDAFYGPTVGIPNYSSVTNDLATMPDDYYSGLIQERNHQVAVFGQGTYTLFNRLDLTAGLRFFDWGEHYSIRATGLGGNLVPASNTQRIGTPTTQSSDVAASGVTPRFAALFRLNKDINIWTEAAKGFRYGGANQPIPLSYCGADLASHGLQSGPLGFGPDKLWSYSLGEKSRLFHQRMTFNVTGFWIDWKDTQTANYLNCSYYYTSNVGRVTSRGIEIDATILIARGLRLNLNGSYNDAYAADPVTNLNAPAGTRSPYAPVYLASLTAQYDREVWGHDLQLDLNYSYKGSYTNEFDHTDSGFRVIPESNSLNASITYQLPHVDASVFANNITNEASIYNIGTQTVGALQPGDFVAVARPRTIGLRLRSSF